MVLRLSGWFGRTTPLQHAIGAHQKLERSAGIITPIIPVQLERRGMRGVDTKVQVEVGSPDMCELKCHKRESIEFY
jgi:hypothetical protein